MVHVLWAIFFYSVLKNSSGAGMWSRMSRIETYQFLVSNKRANVSVIVGSRAQWYRVLLASTATMRKIKVCEIMTRTEIVIEEVIWVRRVLLFGQPLLWPTNWNKQQKWNLKKSQLILRHRWDKIKRAEWNEMIWEINWNEQWDLMINRGKSTSL